MKLFIPRKHHRLNIERLYYVTPTKWVGKEAVADPGLAMYDVM